MKTDFVLVLSLAIVSCREDNLVVIPKKEYDELRGIKIIVPEYPKTIKIQGIREGGSFDEMSLHDAHILLVDSCEYIFIPREGDGGPILTHKGNCKFCNKRNYGIFK